MQAPFVPVSDCSSVMGVLQFDDSALACLLSCSCNVLSMFPSCTVARIMSRTHQQDSGMQYKILVTALAALCAGSGVARADDLDLAFSGKMYADVTHLDRNISDAGKGDDSGFGIDVRRFYLTVNPKFDPVWSANLTTDFKYVQGDGLTNLYVKKAYLQGVFSRAAVLRVGSADLPWVPMVEHYYGYRYVENTLIDRLKFGTSADWGLHLGGAFGSTGRFNYAVSVVNGGGYKHPDRSQSVDVGARIGFSPIDGLQIALGGYTGKLGKDAASVDTAHTAKRTDALVAWSKDGLRVGGEYFHADNWNKVLSTLSDSADGYSLWASQDFGKRYAVFARYDRAAPSKELDPAASDRYLNLGFQYQVNKAIKLAAVYKHDQREYTAATPAPEHRSGTRSNEVGLWGEVKF